MKAIIYPDSAGEWRWHVRGDNGEIIAHGESYIHRINAMDAVKLLFTTNKVDVETHGRGGEITNNYRLVRPLIPDSAEHVITAAETMTPDTGDVGLMTSVMPVENPGYLPPGVDPNEPYPHPDDEDE